MSDRGRAKTVRRAVASSDVTRARVLGLVALGAVAAALGTVATSGLRAGHDRAVAPPHARAGLTCAKCHEPGQASPAFAASSACTSCHAGSAHASVRPAHRSLAARGELACATCHPAHDSFQGITFEADGGAVRWGAGAPPMNAEANATFPKQVTVPLVSLSACAKCHDPRDSHDPIAACVSSDVRRTPETSLATRPSLCFDEHRSPARADARGVAWEAARTVAVTTPWLSPAYNARTPWLPVAGAFGGAAAFGALFALRERRRREDKPEPPKLDAPTARRKLPVIDASRCLGCYACVDACPFDVLTVEKYVAVVARPDECCGVVLCERVCPNGSLSIDDGGATKDVPHVDENLESPHVPGLYLAGDLTGLPLIKNAIHQGVRVVDRIVDTLPKKRPEPIDILVVGAGPAGLSAALRAREKGLSCVVLEQASVAASIKSFPRDKIVHDPPLELPVVGELWLREATKEELVAQWTRIVRSRAIDVREGHRVTCITPRGTGFDVHAALESGDARFLASRVVIAIGRRGTPKTLPLTIEPGAESKISHALADARSFAGKRVLVVGLGDSAMEAAVALARQPGTTVTVSYRGRDFTRGKARNVNEMKQLLAKGALKVLFGTVPVAVNRTSVKLSTGQTLPMDAVLVLVGGQPSWDLLEVAGVRRRGEGEEA